VGDFVAQQVQSTAFTEQAMDLMSLGTRCAKEKIVLMVGGHGNNNVEECGALLGEFEQNPERVRLVRWQVMDDEVVSDIRQEVCQVVPCIVVHLLKPWI
jgi:hypothetical protein